MAASAARLAGLAVRAASQVRAAHGVGPSDAISPFDLAERMGVRVRCDRLRRIEGICSPEPEPAITLARQLPSVRRRYMCAHEIGHHVFRHGLRVDRPVPERGESQDAAEFLADRFALALLMPKLAIDAALARRGCALQALGPTEAYTIAQDLGVEYADLVEAVEQTFGGLTEDQARRLRSAGSRLASVRASLAGFPVERDLVLADRNWGARPIDVDVGDAILCPDLVHVSGRCIGFRVRPRPHFVATAPGRGCLVLAPGRMSTEVCVDPLSG